MRRLSGTCADFVLCPMAAKHSTNHGEHMADHWQIPFCQLSMCQCGFCTRWLAMICLLMQFWTWFCGCHCRQMLRGTCFFSHCASNIVCLVTRLCSIWKAGATGAGLHRPGRYKPQSDKFSSCATNISQCFSAPWIPRCFAVHLPNSIGAGNRTLAFQRNAGRLSAIGSF